MFTTGIDQLVEVQLRQDRSSGQGTSIRGEAQYTAINLLTLYPNLRFMTWLHRVSARQIQFGKRQVDYDATWEVRKFIQTKLIEATATTLNRGLRVGDKVRFKDRPQWWHLHDEDSDSGIFNTIPIEKFRLVKNEKAQR